MPYIALLISAVLVGMDQLTKWLASTYVKPVHSVEVIKIAETQILNFTYHENTGAAFSILSGKQTFLIIITSIYLILFILYLLIKRPASKLLLSSMALIIGGGVGNLIDRIFNGYVVDFIDFRVIKFAVFNFADICAVIGAVLLAVAIIKSDRKQAKETYE